MWIREQSGWRRRPITITGIAVDATTNRVTVTAATHGFHQWLDRQIADVVGMTAVNGKVYAVADKAANTSS